MTLSETSDFEFPIARTFLSSAEMRQGSGLGIVIASAKCNPSIHISSKRS
jgi:hypothetical protein